MSKIKIGKLTLPYSGKVICKTKSGSQYTILVLKGKYLGDMLIKKNGVHSKYHYLIGIGKIYIKQVPLKETIKTFTYNLMNPEREIPYDDDFFFEDKLKITNNNIYFKSAIGSVFIFKSFENLDELNKNRYYKKVFLNSSKEDPLENSLLKQFGTSTKCTSYQII